MEKPLFLGPVFVQNPDGSIVQGVPPGFHEPTPPGTPRLGADMNFNSLSADIVRVLARHEALFLSLMVMHLVVVCSFQYIELQYKDDAVMELTLIYPDLTENTIRSLHWLAFVGEASYSIAFFGLGMVCACVAKPVLYARFAVVALIGTLGQLPMAYLNRFNLLIFFLRFLSYAYARFLCNLLRTIDTLRGDTLINADP
eukprot:CAMPEP_0181410870 /NCGR_PEP_ID=MMETSP1110-20121109/7567_1 /TAXON_ID=174948 /ORGANISM="Symbiodinium sp., Strain CCMP421" /LENGTH=198 /DNA_ID=CAMNT_0023533441 /DNA_START=149 /DNA_END=745 /DNA_ORIENTATION=-